MAAELGRGARDRLASGSHKKRKSPKRTNPKSFNVAYRHQQQPPFYEFSLALKHPIFSEIRRHGGQVRVQGRLLREAQEPP